MSLQLKNIIFSEHHHEWALYIKKLLYDYQKNCQNYNKINISNINLNTDLLHKKQMKCLQSIRKIYLFLNRTKPTYYSFQPKILHFWKTINRKRIQFIKDIDYKLINKICNDKELNYLSLFKITLEKYDPTYGFQIGLILHRKFNSDIALVINEYLM